MKGRRLAALLGAGVIAGLLVTPASGEVVVPEEAQINDPFNDGNLLNDQGLGGTGVNVNGNFVGVPDTDDVTGPDDLTATADVGKVWFSATADTVSAHVQTEAPAPSEEAVYYRVFATPGEGTASASTLGCLRFLAIVPGSAEGGGTYQGEQWAKIHDVCNIGTSIFTHTADAELTIDELEDGSGVVTITAPREYSPLLQGDKVAIKRPYVETVLEVGAGPSAPTGQLVGNSPKYDTTKIGTDIEVSAGGGGKVPCSKLQKLGGTLIVGTKGADEIHGTKARDIICGLKGDDVIYGYDDKDVILGGPGVDVINGNDGDDDLRGAAQNDTLEGGVGVDKLNGGAGDDSLTGGAGSDRLNGSKGKDVCRSGGGLHEQRRHCEK